MNIVVAMDANKFYTNVQRRAELGMVEEAQVATDAVLKTLAERLAAGEVDDLASQLSEPLGEKLVDTKSGSAEQLSVDTFLQHVANRAKVDKSTAEEYSQAVITVLSTATTGGEFDDARAQFPDEFDQLFEPAEASEEPR